MPWLLWLTAFYCVWVYLVFVGERWAVVVAHWPMAAAMAVGSYVAGSTPMGGGTVGFPILVLGFHAPASLGRDFSFAVQSIGMTSASILILTRRQPLAKNMLKGSLTGAFVGLPLGTFVIVPLVSELWIKLVFAIIWGAFGIFHLYRMDEVANGIGEVDANPAWEFRVGLVLGIFAAALVTSVTGVGIDMVLYAALVLLCRADLKVAIPTSVIIMAFCSVLGVALRGFTVGLQPGVFENWLAAAPIVALGAPLGAYVVELVGRRLTLLSVAILCIGQFGWTCYAERAHMGLSLTLGAISGVVLWLLAFERLRAWGLKIGSRKARASLGVVV
jgi:uncharacterized membrane protein YfcA